MRGKWFSIKLTVRHKGDYYSQGIAFASFFYTKQMPKAELTAHNYQQYIGCPQRP